MSGGDPPPHDAAAEPCLVQRFAVRATALDPAPLNAALSPRGTIAIVDDETGIGAALAARLEARGERTVRIGSGKSGTDDVGTVRADCTTREGIGSIVHAIAMRGEAAKAVVDLSALRAGFGPVPFTGSLLLAQALEGDLAAASQSGGAAFLGVTRIDGCFGFDEGMAEFDAWHGLVPGFCKSLAQEWGDVRVKCVDVAPCDAADAADRVLAELFSDDGAIEVGYRRDGARTTVALDPNPNADGATAPMPIDGGTVVVVTGGARGIAAEVAHSLAVRYQPVLVLLGRTDPADDDPEFANAADRVTLRRALFERRRDESPTITPAVIEAEVNRICNAREVRANIERLRATGATVAYVRCDVRDRDDTTRCIAHIYDEYGRIDGVIHAAGVVEDKLVRDKRPESFLRVVETKALSAHHLIEALRPESLRFLAFFSSVSGRFGNRGQSDYAAASETLNKLALRLDAQWPGRVVSIDWGPWAAGGMMSPEVRRQFEARGVALVPVDAGCRMFEAELCRARAPEVVIAASTPGPPIVPAALETASIVVSADGAGTEVVRTLDVTRDHFLLDHCIDGAAVMPFALAMELMAAAATTGVGNVGLAELRDIRLNKGIVLAEGAATLRIAAVPVTTAADMTTSFDVRIETDELRPNYAASVDFGSMSSAHPTPLTALGKVAAYPLSLDETYDSYLFHGPKFRGITAITAMGAGGASATLRFSRPSDCITGLPDDAVWAIDPVMIDSALQMQVVWARHYWDITLLPARIDGYRQLVQPRSALGEVRHELRVRASAKAPLCVADHWFFAGERLIATLTGVQGIGSKALNRLTHQ
jgi:NAD(P)-dependent dehydrogenase (short-subunit alcohol dehydrogenase family)